MQQFEGYPELNGVLDSSLMPRHIGIIMDGNGRWAKNRGLPRMMGHRAGVERLRSVITFCSRAGIEALTVYAFSTENWKRPTEEVNALMLLMIEFLKKETRELHQNQVCIRFVGDVDALGAPVIAAIRNSEAVTNENSGLKLNIAVNYGGRAEIVKATKTLANAVKLGDLTADSITESVFSDTLYTRGMPDIDLVIRTSGEQRVSNFMLFQTAYAEFIFTQTHWPDFDDQQFILVLQEFQNRNRRFGGL